MGDSNSEFVRESMCQERIHRLEDRIVDIETVTKEIHNLTISVERLAITVESMLARLSEQEDRIDIIEKEDGEKWRSLVKYVVTAVAGLIVGYLAKNFGV